ncbi:RbsD/FucU family protein [Pelagibacterium montanilacus]|uniref:RbsD/FucU family protein n=1 Tax=Pelagibacterium montanilacus TaxID=2185280 RepID=UPI000F8CA33D|nr:RbsD/FucU domain-containing protein [Pelagibacterium montanilacus]
MLKGIDPILGPDALYVLRAMGHGDDLVIVDANFPAFATAQQTPYGKPVHFDAPLRDVVRAVLSVMTIDGFVDDAVARMEVVGKPDEMPEAVAEVQGIVTDAGGTITSLERFAFYERSKKAFAIFSTNERRFYANLAIRKGVIGPEG